MPRKGEKMELEKKKEVLAFLQRYRQECAEIQAIGSREVIAGTECIIHRAESERQNMPALFVLHGGSWVGGDAVIIDSLCHTIANSAKVLAVNVNYTKLDVKPFPNPFEEVCRILQYFSEHSQEYGVDPEKFVLCGHSAGAHIVAGAAVMAKDRGIKLARQILVYPFVDWTGSVDNPLPEWGIAGIDYQEIVRMFFSEIDLDDVYVSPLVANADRLCGMAPADIIICGNDILRPHGVAYYDKMRKIGVESTLKEYPAALHGFLEVNRPDFVGESPAKGEEQAEYARDCERYIADILKKM